MKKVILIVAGVLFLVSAQAQFKPEKGTFGVELQFRPFGNNVIQTSSTDFELPNPTGGNTRIPVFGISPRFFVSDKMELRVDLSFGSGVEKNENTQDVGNGNVTETTKTSLTGFGLDLGANYHFNGTERVSPYVGAVLGIGIGKISQKVKNAGNVTGDTEKGKAGLFQLDFGVVTGFNWYFVNGLYLGAEVGLGLVFEKPGKIVSETTTGGITNTTTIEPTSSNFGVGFEASPAIRLGWKF